jgi:hypothetical protein
MKQIIKIFLFLLISSSCYAQKIYVTKYKSQANFLVYRTKYLNQAELIAYRTDNINESSITGMWFYVDALSKADWVIYYTPYINEANLVVFFTDNRLIAGEQPNLKPNK